MQTQRSPARWLPLRWAAGMSEPGPVCQGPSSSARMPWGAAGPGRPVWQEMNAASAAGPSAEHARALLVCRNQCQRASLRKPSSEAQGSAATTHTGASPSIGLSRLYPAAEPGHGQQLLSHCCSPICAWCRPAPRAATLFSHETEICFQPQW